MIETIIDASGVAPAIEDLLPRGVRSRQLTARTLLTGMMLTVADDRPAQLTRVHAALTSLPEADQARLGVTAGWKTGPHQLTYRQAEHTCRLIARALAKGNRTARRRQALQASLRPAAGGQHPRRTAKTPPVAGRGLDRRRNLVPAAPARHHRMRRPRSRLGAPQHQPARAQGRDVLRLLPVRGAMTGEENGPPVPGAGPPDDPVLLPPRPGPRPGPRADRGCQRTASRSATSSTTPATPTATPQPGPSRCGRPAPSSSRTSTRTTAARKEPTTAPSSPTGTCTARPPRHRCSSSPAAARRHRRADRRARPADSRAGPAQARPAHRRRRRRLPPRHLPRRRRQDPLPAPPGLDDPQPGPARDPHPARAPARLLHPADHHRPDPRSRPRPGRNTTTHPRRTGAPTPGAPAPSAPSPPSRTPPPPASPAAGAASPAWPRSPCGSPACSPSATSASSPPGDARQDDNARRAAAGLPPRTRKRRRTSLAQLAAGP